MARLAPGLEIGVQDLRLVLVTARAVRRVGESLAAMRIVAERALLVPGRCAGRLLRVTTAARGRRRGLVRRGSVARRAVGVTPEGRNAGALGAVAFRAEGELRSGRRERVRLVALHAEQALSVRAAIAGRHFGMARRARARLGVGVVSVGHVARDAGILVSMIDVNLGVAAATRRRRGPRCVRRVARGALRVRHRLFGCQRGQQRRLGAVAADADSRGLRDEVVRLVAGEARVVPSRLGTCRVLVTSGAGRARSTGGVVRFVAIEAVLAVFVLSVRERSLVVTIDAGFHRDRRRFVRVMARLALGRPVGRYRR
jgi:hypothetical protein